MSRLGGAAAVAPLVADISSEVRFFFPSLSKTETNEDGEDIQIAKYSL